MVTVKNGKGTIEFIAGKSSKRLGTKLTNNTKKKINSQQRKAKKDVKKQNTMALHNRMASEILS